MRHVTVAFFSQTGSTRQVAETIATTIEAELGAEARVARWDLASGEDCARAGEHDQIDLLLVGFPVHYNNLPRGVKKPVRQFLAPPGTKVAFFYTYGVPDRGFYAGAERAIKRLVTRQQWTSLGTFGCLGEHHARHHLAKFNPAKAEEARASLGHPDETDLAAAATFARKVLERAGESRA